MKRITMTILTGMAAVIAGCVTTSLNPFYTDQELVFEPGLLGPWVAVDSEGKLLTNQTIEFKRDGDKGYLAVNVDQNDEGVTETCQAEVRLFRLSNQLFFDHLTLNSHGPEFVPVHRLFKVVSINPTLQTRELSYQWLKITLEDNPDALRHQLITERDAENSEASTRLVLTASTQELQDFLVPYIETEEAWDEASEVVRPPAGSTRAEESPVRVADQGN